MHVFWAILASWVFLTVGSFSGRVERRPRAFVFLSTLILLISIWAYLRLPLWQYWILLFAGFSILVSIRFSGVGRKILSGLSLVLLVFASVCGYLFPLFVPQPTTGPHPVGYFVHYHDLSNLEMVAEAKLDQRVVPIKVWFPAKDKGEEQVSFDEAWVGLKAKYWFVPVLPDLMGNLSLSKTAATNADMAIEGISPVVIYNHGGGYYPEDNHVLLENLASHGYIVVSVGHPQISSSIRYPDGTTQSANYEAYGRTDLSVEEQIRLNESFDQALQASGYDEYYALIEEYVLVPDPSEYRLQDRVANTMAIVDILADLPIIGSSVDNNNIVFMGYSFGGATSIEICYRYPGKCSALINLDGLPGKSDGIMTADLATAMLLLSGESVPGAKKVFSSSQFVAENNSGISYNIEIEGATHRQFTSEGFYSPLFNIDHGARQYYQTQASVERLILAFLGKHVLGVAESDLPLSGPQLVVHPD